MNLISDDQREQFDRLGYFVTKPMFSADALRAAYLEFDRLWAEDIERANQQGHPKVIDNIRHRAFISDTCSRSRILADFVIAPIYLDACAALIGPDADLFYNQAVIKPPADGKRFGWHQDSGYCRTYPLSYITCWTAISRSFLENGCIWVIPGSHKHGIVPHLNSDTDWTLEADIADETGAIPVEMEPGQVAIFSSLTLHKSGANTSREVRYGFVPQYHVPGVRRADSGDLVGNQHPILRGGRRAESAVFA